jgi:polysaccharide export outer membrane protein
MMNIALRLRLKRGFSILLLAALVIPCWQARAQTGGKEYVIAPNDLLEISVYGENDLSTITRVAQDGTVNYPFLGNIRAAGLTVRELESSITELLAEDYLVDPQVNVLIKEYSKISILGAVRAPGSYELKEKMTLSEVIALAGGFQETADTTRIKLTRVGAENKETVEVNVDAILAKQANDIEMQGNDMIIVDEYGRFSIMGQVFKPGVYSLKKGLTAVEAVGLAGGFTTTAAQNGTRVVRVTGGVKKILSVPVADIMRGGDSSRDVVLEPGDTVVVPESFF